MIYLTIIAAIAVLCLPLLRWVDAKDRQAADELRERELKAHREQLDGLLNRIQAPEVAVARSIDVEDPGPGYIPVTDDAAMNAHTSEVLAQLEQLQYGG